MIMNCLVQSECRKTPFLFLFSGVSEKPPLSIINPYTQTHLHNSYIPYFKSNFISLLPVTPVSRLSSPLLLNPLHHVFGDEGGNFPCNQQREVDAFESLHRGRPGLGI